MIKIDIESIKTARGSYLVKGDLDIKGNPENIENEIYALIRAFEDRIPEIYDRVIVRRISELEEGGD